MAGKSAHWIQFDQPELVVEAVRELAVRAAHITNEPWARNSN
jgi:hypothetical protein